MFAIVDCNNFYASCERLFRPDLRHKPIVVLSNNDGCCIARSEEAKALGIAMGEPYFKIKSLCRQHGVAVFSSNYTLYGNISHRVMCTIAEFWPHVEVYSIDEVFLDLSTLPVAKHEAFCHKLQQTILRHTGIPTSIGLGASKTLAKAANYFGKKVYKTPVFNMMTQMPLLQQLAIAEVWGVGRRFAKKLSAQGIHSAYDLAMTNIHLLKKNFNVLLMRTALELRGIPCAGLEPTKPHKSIISSKSFSHMQTSFDALAEALSSYCARAVDKLRRQQSVTQHIHVFLYTNRFREDLAPYFPTIGLRLSQPTDDISVITKAARLCLQRIFKSGYHYKKAGICLEELMPKSTVQLDLFYQEDEKKRTTRDILMHTVDKINHKYGKGTVHLAAEGHLKPWEMRSEMKSPAYTTRWSDVPKAIIHHGATHGQQ